MGVLAPLVKRAQPALVGGGCSAAATGGATWQWTFDGIVDDSGVAINLTGVTGTATIYSQDGGVVMTLTFTGAVGGSFVLSKDESATVGLGSSGNGLQCKWGLTLADGTDIVQAWAPSNSDFTILKATP